MSRVACPRHPGSAATHRCDGCGELLCAECVRTGHRLDFCVLCGERALPLDGSGAVAPPPPNTITERRRQAIARSAAGYGLAQALGYPFRGLGAFAFWSFVVMLAVMDLIDLAFPLGLGRMVTWFFRFAILLLTPRFLFSIANSTARGHDELPDWPDFDYWELIRSALLFVFVGLLCLLPLCAFMYLVGCGPLEMLSGTVSLGACLAAMAAGFFVAVALWVPTFGATALFDTFLAAFRIDLHVRAMLVAPAQMLGTTVLLTALLFTYTLLPTLLKFIPLVGWVAAHAVAAYALFVGAHLVGVYFRRHWGRLEELYMG